MITIYGWSPKPEGTTLTEVEHQSGKYVNGLPDWIRPPVYPLPFIYESTGKETRFTNEYDPDARSRQVFTFHRPETLAEWRSRSWPMRRLRLFARAYERCRRWIPVRCQRSCNTICPPGYGLGTTAAVAYPW
jgi:hypothetical protein